MCLVDTPGIGSVFSGNTAVTREFVPHVDAALVVLGADPPISGEELALLREVSQHVSELLFVLNKADRLPEDHRAQAIRFTEKILTKHLKRPIGRIFEISAVAPGSHDWQALKTALETLARDSGAALAVKGAARQTQRLAQALRLEIAEHRSALLRPVENSQARIAKLRTHVESGERSLYELSHLLDAEEEQLTNVLTQKRAVFLPSARETAAARLVETVTAEHTVSVGKLRESAIKRAQDLAKQILDNWREEVQPQAEGLYRKAEERFVQLANEFTRKLQDAGEDLGAPSELAAEVTFRAKSGLFYTSLMSHTSVSAVDWILNRLRTRKRATVAITRQATVYLDELLITNTSRIMYDLVSRARESRRELEWRVRRQIKETVARAERGLARAQQAHAAGSKEVEQDLTRLDGLAAMLSKA